MKATNSTALVTGANRGIGLALVGQALKKGAARTGKSRTPHQTRQALNGLPASAVSDTSNVSNRLNFAFVSSLIELHDFAGFPFLGKFNGIPAKRPTRALPSPKYRGCIKQQYPPQAVPAS